MENTPDTGWTNFQILKEIMFYVLDDIYRSAANPYLKDLLRKTIDKGDDEELQKHLITLQLAPVLDILLFLDSAVGPDSWPGVELVNAKTRESLSLDFGMDFASIKRQYLLAKHKSTTE